MLLARSGAIAALGLALALVAAPHAADAQTAAKVRRIGYLGTGSAAGGYYGPFVEGLRELGWVEGQNIDIAFRSADSNYDRLAALAAELVRLGVEIIVAQPTASAHAASKATRVIPIVMLNAGEPVEIGLVDSLARPGGNVTGTAYTVGLETIGKGLELLKEAMPAVRQVAVLSNPGNPAQPLAIRNLETVAHPLGLRLSFFEARKPDEFAGVFAKIGKERPEALLVVAESLFRIYRTPLADLALKHRLPTMFGIAENAEAGGLMAYGPSLSHGARRGATFVDKILKGARPADLPAEQPTKFELVINLKTAKALGVAMPPSLLLRADRVFE